MQLFGPANEARGSHPPSSTADTPFTFTFTQIQTSDSETAPFLKLPAELRNKIYELAASDEEALRLSAGNIILPSMGRVCKKIRAEMRGIYEHEVISNAALKIEALVINFDFKSLFGWLDEHDRQIIPESKQWTPRELRIHVTCQPEPLMTPPEDETLSRCSTARDLDSLPRLLLQNLSATMSGWSWDFQMFRSVYPSDKIGTWSIQQLIQTVGVSSLDTHSRCKRALTGHHYTVAFIADDTWNHLSHAAPLTLEVIPGLGVLSIANPDAPDVKFYDKMYETIMHFPTLTSGVDRKLALMLREVCQSDCSKAERDAVAGTLDMYLGRIRPNVTVELSTTQFWKWNFTIANRAVNELSRMWGDHHAVPIDLRYYLPRKAGDKRTHFIVDLRAKKRPRPIAPKLVEPRITSKADLNAELIPHRDGATSEIEEIIRMMARWHL